MAYIFIHESGQTSSSWDETILYMSEINNISCPEVFSLLEGFE